MPWNIANFDSLGLVKDARTLGEGYFSYTPTHYVAPHADIAGVSSDEDPQDAAAFAAAMSESTPCTLMCAVTYGNGTVLAGQYIRLAPGQYESEAVAQGESFVPRFEPQGDGFSAANPLVFFAQYPASHYHSNPALLSEFVQLQGITGRDASGTTRTKENCPGFIAARASQHIRFDGFYMQYDAGNTRTFGIIPPEEVGVIGLHSGSTDCEISRCYVQCDGFNTDTGENSSWLFMNNARDCRIVDCKFEGNGTSQNHNSAAIQTRWADDCIIEHNYFDGINSIWNKGANWGPFRNDAYDTVGATNLMFDNGSTRPLAGQTVTDAVTGATAVCLFDAMRDQIGGAGGAWGSGTAEGWIPVHNIVGTFGLGNPLQISGVTVATVGYTGEVYVSGAYHRARNCVVRYNFIVNSVIYSMMDTDQENITYYQNFCHATWGSTWKYTTPNTNDWNQYGYGYSFTNNTLICQGGTYSFVLGGDGALTPIKSTSQIHSNIVVNDGSDGMFGLEAVWPADGNIDDFDIWDRNVYYNRSGGEHFELGFDVGGPEYTSLVDWKNYADDFGLQPGQPTELYEENSVNTDPQFVSANWTSPELGDWTLASSGQDARTIGLASANGGVCGAWVTGEEEIGLRANPTYGIPVLWATNPDTTSPFNFNSVYNGTYAASTDQYANCTTLTESTTEAGYPYSVIHTNHFEGGQVQMGGDLFAKVGDFWPALVTADVLFFRFLIKYGTQDSAAEWAGSWTSGGASGGHEYKWPDIGWETDGNRVIFVHQPYNDTSHGSIGIRIDGSGGQDEYDVATNLVSNTWYYVEAEINGSGALRAWVAEYDGTNTEYSEGSPTFENLTAHTWAPDWGPEPSRIAHGFLNHNCVPAQDRYFLLAINDSFIGPGQTVSEN